MELQKDNQSKKDDSFSGLVIIAGLLLLLVGFIYLLSVQQKNDDCQTSYNPDGSVRAGCAVSAPLVSPTPETSVELLDQLNKNEVSEVDKRLQEAAQDLINKQEQQKKQNQQSSPQMPQ